MRALGWLLLALGALAIVVAFVLLFVDSSTTGQVAAVIVGGVGGVLLTLSAVPFILALERKR